MKAYTEPTANYLHSQPVYPGHQQGVVVQQGGTVTTIVTSQTVQQVAYTAFLNLKSLKLGMLYSSIDHIDSSHGNKNTLV